MHDYELTIDGEDTRAPDKGRNKSGRGRLYNGTVTAPDAAGALREVSEYVADLPESARNRIVRVQLKRAD